MNRKPFIEYALNRIVLYITLLRMKSNSWIFRMLILSAVFIRSSVSNQCVQSTIVENYENTLQSSSSVIKWAIVALARPTKLSDIKSRNKVLYEKLLPYKGKHDITLLFFSEKVFPQNAIDNWTKSFDGLAKVEFINTADKGFSNPKERFGYKYMCKFFSLDLYDYLRDKYDYYLRCDTDCYINIANFDLLQWAEDNRVQYGYTMRKKEAHKPTADTLPAFTQKYLNKCQVNPSSVMDVPLSFCFNFYNNFHIGSVSFFNRPDVRHYLLAANASGGILEFRWGDSTIQAYAVRLFADPRRLGFFTSLLHSFLFI